VQKQYNNILNNHIGNYRTTEWNDKSGFASVPLCRISLNFANLILNIKESVVYEATCFRGMDQMMRSD